MIGSRVATSQHRNIKTEYGIKISGITGQSICHLLSTKPKEIIALYQSLGKKKFKATGGFLI